MDYLELLNRSFKHTNESLEEEKTRLAYLSDFIFDFTTYDEEIDELFAKKALEVCVAINSSKTYEYIEKMEDYRWYLIMCNMPFFQAKLNWGTSIRGAFWDLGIGKTFDFTSLGLYRENGTQILDTIYFNKGEWELFIKAMTDFIGE